MDCSAPSFCSHRSSPNKPALKSQHNDPRILLLQYIVWMRWDTSGGSTKEDEMDGLSPCFALVVMSSRSTKKKVSNIWQANNTRHLSNGWAKITPEGCMGCVCVCDMYGVVWCGMVLLLSFFKVQTQCFWSFHSSLLPTIFLEGHGHGPLTPSFAHGKRRKHMKQSKVK